MKSDLNLLSPQQSTLYREILAAPRPITAKDIAGKLGIFPHSVYRAVECLEKYGLVERINERPLRFLARSAEETVDKMFFAYRDWFIKNFSSGNKLEKVEDDLDISFIQGRDKWIECSTSDLQTAEKEYFLIVSGDEVPAEVILAQKRAMERGVEIRMIVQRLDGENREMLKNWRRLGTKIRFGPTIRTRVTLIDSKIVYLISYDPEDYKKALGVRIAYPPVASLMREMFYQRWKQSEKL